MSLPEPQKKGRGCLFYGCITCLVLFLVLTIAGFMTVRYLINTANGYILQYTDTSPMAMPKAELPAAELEKLNARVAAFNNALKAHSNAPPLVLTGPEINALMSNSKEAKDAKLGDKFFVSLEGDQIKGQVSMPLEDIHIPFIKTKGRYLNGAGSFNALLTNAYLSVRVQSLEVKGKPLPPQFMTQIRQANLADGFNKDTNSAAMFDRYESVVVKDGKLIVNPKPN